MLGTQKCTDRAVRQIAAFVEPIASVERRQSNVLDAVGWGFVGGFVAHDS